MRAIKAPENPEKQGNIIVEKLNRKQIEREIKHRRVAVGGYKDANKELTKITDALEVHYRNNEDATSSAEPEYTLSGNLSDLREDILNGTLKPITTEQAAPRKIDFSNLDNS